MEDRAHALAGLVDAEHLDLDLGRGAAGGELTGARELGAGALLGGGGERGVGRVSRARDHGEGPERIPRRVHELVAAARRDQEQDRERDRGSARGRAEGGSPDGNGTLQRGSTAGREAPVAARATSAAKGASASAQRSRVSGVTLATPASYASVSEPGT